MDNDDAPVGYVLNRRELLALLGTAGVTALAGCSRTGTGTPATAGTSAAGGAAAPAGGIMCIARPEQTEGPYFVDERLNRSDIRSDPADGTIREGAPLALTFVVSRLSGATCTPLAGAYVDVWQCDAAGVYSDVTDPRFSSVGQKHLRGYQVTDAAGRAVFQTIYPGWYQGRTVHIHFKIRSSLASPSYEFTSQLYFDDALTDTIHAQQPYAAKGVRTVRNSGDGIFRRGGSQLLLAPVEMASGYAADFTVALQA